MNRRAAGVLLKCVWLPLKDAGIVKAVSGGPQARLARLGISRRPHTYSTRIACSQRAVQTRVGLALPACEMVWLRHVVAAVVVLCK